MIPLKTELKQREKLPRSQQPRMTAALREGWYRGGVHWHATYSDERFKHRHATAAGYAPRKVRYVMKKLAKFGHTRPLEHTGESRRASRTANITSTSKGNKISYPGLRKFNFRNPNSQVNMAVEFRKVLESENVEVAKVIDRTMDEVLNK